MRHLSAAATARFAAMVLGEALDTSKSLIYIPWRDAGLSCSLSEAHASGVGFRASGGLAVTYLAYLDQFGHIAAVRQ